MRRIPTVLAALGCAITSSCAPGPVTQGPDDARSAFPVASAARVVRNVVYAQYGERRLELDLYLPSESSHPRPVPGVLVVLSMALLLPAAAVGWRLRGCVFFPEDGHIPSCAWGDPAEVLKVVVKVRV